MALLGDMRRKICHEGQNKVNWTEPNKASTKRPRQHPAAGPLYTSYHHTSTITSIHEVIGLNRVHVSFLDERRTVRDAMDASTSSDSNVTPEEHSVAKHGILGIRKRVESSGDGSFLSMSRGKRPRLSAMAEPSSYGKPDSIGFGVSLRVLSAIGHSLLS